MVSEIVAFEGSARPPIKARASLMERLEGARGCVALIVASPGGLRAANRICGHDSGDAMLADFSRALSESAPEDALIAKIGGAKLGVIFDATGPATAETKGRELVADLAMIGAPGVAADPRIGLCFAPEGGEPDAILNAALNALERSKRGGAAVEVVIHDPARDADELGAARAALGAIRSGRATMALQPVVAADQSGRVMFREALIRVQGPDGKPMAAGQFMPALDRLGLTEEADIAVLKLAFEELRRDETTRISVNLSGASLARNKWLAAFEDEAHRSPDCAERIIIEVTEEAALNDAVAATGLFALLRARGATLALDDFGAGRTSFSQLRDFRFDMVKIDGGYIKGIDASPDNQMLVAALRDISRQFDMAVVAEFVETAEEARTLRKLGVDGLQGYLFGRPQLVWSDGAKVAQARA